MLIFDVLFYIFILVLVIQIIFYSFVFGNFSIENENVIVKELVPISIIICAKNEAKNLTKHLPFILEQDYLKFEVILINDSSSDKTLSVMEDFKAKNSNIKIVDVKNIEAFWGNKKYALTLGIKAATYNHLLFTDADCKPVSNKWIREMSQHFSKKESIVLGYGAYKKEKRSFLNKLIRFETLLTAVQYFSYAKWGQPYMGVGRNLAYTKEIFFEASGFMNHMKIRSGDDDLFVNETADKSNTAICISKESFTESTAKKTYKDWLTQKRRHISTAKYYKSKHQVLLTVFYLSQLLFYVLSIILISTLFYWKIVIGLIIFRSLVVGTSLFLASKKLNEKDLIAYLPLLELFLIIMQFSIFIKNLSSKPNRWN